LHGMGQPKRFLRIQRGYENFYFPGTWQLLDLPRERPDIVHCHNLHGNYFDLRVLPWLSQKVPVVLTLHDAWLLSGHCAHSFDCERWKTGCGECPDLTISPAIKRDATAYNWRRKRDIFAKCRLYVATPCQWLMDRIQQSILAPAIEGAKVIPNGIPLSVFHPYDKAEARKELGLPLEAKILLFTANSIRRNIWKDYETLRAAMSKVTRSLTGKSILFLALGESAPTERIGKVEVRFIPYQTNPSVVARYYQAADIYTHAARIDTFPTTLLEALACGTPVVATAVGGIPEQIEDGVTGFLTPPGDDNAMAAQIERLLDDDGLRTRMGVQATKTVRSQFSIKRQVNEYLSWYKEILGA
ncbi:MAG: glycosyltransferase, partial [Desulfobacteraceae bacterium]|nr:glycosyltransferase [Desulfobacteraceae bacterium]